MVDKWLSCMERTPCPFSCFKVFDVHEISAPSTKVKSSLLSQLQAALFEPTFLEDMAKYLGWNRVRKDIVARKVPTAPNIRKGNFGEALMAIILEHFQGYYIPVPKLWFAIEGNQSLPATDFLALKIDKNKSISEVCFVETKLRGSSDKYAAVKGYRQLLEDYRLSSPDILIFVASMLHYSKNPLFRIFASYMRDRRDPPNIDSFHLGLCWENKLWNESVLKNLDDEEVVFDNLTVSVVCINGICELTDEMLDKLSIKEVPADD
jgi:hypothetical protein